MQLSRYLRLRARLDSQGGRLDVAGGGKAGSAKRRSLSAGASQADAPHDAPVRDREVPRGETTVLPEGYPPGAHAATLKILPVQRPDSAGLAGGTRSPSPSGRGWPEAG